MKIVRSLFIAFVLLCRPFWVLADEKSTQSHLLPDLLEEESVAAEVADKPVQSPVYDPLESMNRFFFEVNDKLYIWVMKPVTNGYRWLLPHEIRECLGNFFLNISFPVSLLNSVLQADLHTTAVVVERFVINSTIGIYGFVDIAASEFDIGPRRADFGQTLGRWGLGDGVFLYLPVLGPTNIRDGFGLAADTFSKPLPYFYDDRRIDITLYSTERINALSLNPELYDDLKRFSLDPYVAARQAYTDYRRAFIKRD